jgi:hypothetical protein
MTGQPDRSYVDGATAPPGVGRDRRDTPSLEPPGVGVKVAREQHLPASDAHLLVRRRRLIPELACQLAVRSVQEPVALVFVLADEHDVRPIAVREACVLPPPA